MPTPDTAPATMAPQTPQTEEGTIVGTIAYMSEQVEGKKVDARSDITSSSLIERKPYASAKPPAVDATLIVESPAPIATMAVVSSGFVEHASTGVNSVEGLVECCRKITHCTSTGRPHVGRCRPKLARRKWRYVR
jgi:hypothetical protein